MSFKKVLLLNPPANGKMILKDQYCTNTSKVEYYWIPIDLLILSGDLAEKFEVKVLDSIINGISLEETYANILEYAPDHIVLLSSAITHKSDRALIKKLKGKIDFKTTFLGDVFYFNSKEMIKFEEVDSIIYEYPCPQLVEYIEKGSADSNLVYKETSNGTPVFLPKIKGVNVDYKTPAHDLFPVAKYSVPFMIDELCTSILTNLGCKFSCNYCPASSVNYRERDIESIMLELEYLQRRQIQNIWIRDFTFGLNQSHSIELMKKMRKLNFRWFCLTRAEMLSPEFVQLMSDSGCYLVMLGVDTVNAGTMKNVKRLQNIDELRKKIELLHQSKIFVLTHMILGLPGDGIREMLKTIHYLAFSKASFLSINFFSKRSGSSYYEKKSIYEISERELDSFYADNSTENNTIALKLLKIYALIIFYFNPFRIFFVLSQLKSKRQLIVMIRTGIRLFIPNSDV